MPDIPNGLEAPEDAGVFVPPPPQSLQFRHRVTADSVVSFTLTRLNHPVLNNRPQAILTLTPVGRILAQTGDTIVMQPSHPVGVLFHDGRWHIYNVDYAPMEVGTDFNVAIHEARRPE